MNIKVTFTFDSFEEDVASETHQVLTEFLSEQEVYNYLITECCNGEV